MELLQQFHTAGVVGEDFLGVVLGDDNGRQLVDSDVDLAVVNHNIGSGHAVTSLQGLDDLDSLSDQSISGLCDGGVLAACPDPLNGLVLSIQTGDGGDSLASLLAGGDDGAGDAVVGGQNAVDFLIGVEAGQQGVHSGLCLGVVPVHGSALGEVHLAGNNGQGAVVDQGLQNAHSALEEVGSVGVSGAAAE